MQLLSLIAEYIVVPESRQAFVKDLTTTNYLYQTGIPSITAVTVCFWFQEDTSANIDHSEDLFFSMVDTGR